MQKSRRAQENELNFEVVDATLGPRRSRKPFLGRRTALHRTSSNFSTASFFMEMSPSSSERCGRRGTYILLRHTVEPQKDGP